MFEDEDSHSFYLYLICGNEICNKEITIYREDNRWNARIRDVGYLDNLLIFFRNNTFYEEISPP